MIRSAVYRVDLGKSRGHGHGGRRLGLVVSPTQLPLSVVTVVPTSMSAGASVHRPALGIAGRMTRLLIDQIRSIDTDYVIGGPVGYLTRDQLAEVELALAHYLGVQDVVPPRIT
ncbi:type II toxin-antitoxin system PemK/MazF family toxin [Gryllotalpicola koreensis]|uniref:Type II toxin-antitoxin system toxin endoribonuclease PemK n=1 Tax=Gryllotalpicola koreensis TaxID=993086 RepID=A0ABP8A8U6_9MICO